MGHIAGQMTDPGLHAEKDFYVSQQSPAGGGYPFKESEKGFNS